MNELAVPIIARVDCNTALSREEAKVYAPKEGAEKFTFQAEVNRLMDIIIHSLYSNKVCTPAGMGVPHPVSCKCTTTHPACPRDCHVQFESILYPGMFISHQM